MPNNYRIEDTLIEKSEGSRLDQYWSDADIEKFYKKFRSGLSIPKSHLKEFDNQQKIIERYKVRGFQFGNWTTIEDRLNYLYAFYICLHDLQKVLKIPKNNLGINGSLGISFGARGASGALAHYESQSDIINITRYKTNASLNKEREAFGMPPVKHDKEWRFIYTGGVGAFAHEYGHFLDHYFGMNAEPNKIGEYLSGDRLSLDTSLIYSKEPLTIDNQLRVQVDTIIHNINFTKGKKSSYRKRLEKAELRDYWFKRIELFARIFEQYIDFKLKKIGINNKFLTQRKYKNNVYMTTTELKPLIPLFDDLIKGLRNYL